jgi:hypothetical protein
MNNPNNCFIDKILNYEKLVFDEYNLKRNNLIENIKNLQLKDLDKNQLINLTSDIKLIIDPIKTSIINIDDYFINHNNKFNNNESIKTISNLNQLITFFFLFTGSDSGSESLSVSDSSESSDSE